jgi:hypothetical protein
MARTGPKISLTWKKLKSLFPAMMIAPQDKYIAYALGVTKPETIKQWYHAGKVLQEQFEDKLVEFDDIFSFEYEALFEDRKLEFDALFRKNYDLEPEDKIPDRLYNEYNNFVLNQKRKFIESKIFEREKEIIDKVILSPDESLNEEFKLYVMFSRIYDRARAVKEIGYLQNVDRHCGTSKNVALSLKMLEKMNKDDFGDTVTHTGTIEVNNKSIISMAISAEKAQQQAIEAKKEKIIDVKPINLLELSKEVKSVENKE